ncbi:MAG: hypothetical protein K2X00_21690 [Nitrospiraceae bacterium]|nr:hypothetical protein [Nitrospiraceae bacterium]
MTHDSKQRLSEFLNAIDGIGRQADGHLATCHHSAVEVNDWAQIQAAMANVVGVADDEDKPKGR